MKRVLVLAAVVVALPISAAACGSDGSSAGTLPPIVTTSTTSTTIAPTTTLPEFYVVQANDTLSKIVTKLGVSKDDLMALNGITNPDHIEKGQKLKIPHAGDVIPSTVAVITIAPPDTVAP
jgi:LysM repeat protein